MAPKSYADINGKSKAGKTGGRLAALRSKQGATTQQPDWSRIPAELLWQVVSEWTQDDGSVRFGYSRDGGAYSLTIYADGEKEQWYEHSDEAIWAVLSGLLPQE